MNDNLYDIIDGEDLIVCSEEDSEPLIEGFMNKTDYILIVAREKAGKTILAQQLACSLSSGSPFLDTLEVHQPTKVWYFATEGRTNDLKDRFKRMNNYVKINFDNIKLIPVRFRFNTKEGEKQLKEILLRLETEKPGAIIIDALYRAVKGSIKDDDVVNEFHHVVGWLAYECNCAVIVTHHMRKPSYNTEGKERDKSDDDTFGSAFLKAAVDSIFWLDTCKKEKFDRILRCDTQRSGEIIDNVRLKLEEPDPLYFKMVDIHHEERHQVITVLKTYQQGMPMSQLIKKVSVSKSTLYVILKKLIEDKVIVKTGTKPKIFRVRP